MAYAQVTRLKNKRGGTNPNDSEDEDLSIEELEETRKRLRYLDELDKDKKRKLNDDVESPDSDVQGAGNNVLNLEYIAGLYKKTPTIKDWDRQMEPKRMLLAIVKEFTYNPTISKPLEFEKWENLMESSKTNNTVYKHYFPQNMKDTDEFKYFKQKVQQKWSTISQCIWRYVSSKQNKCITSALLLKLFESHENGSKDPRERRRKLGDLIHARAKKAFEEDACWKLKLTLPDDPELRLIYKNAFFEGDSTGEQDGNEGTVDASLCDDDDLDDDTHECRPESSFTLKKLIAQKVIIIQDALHAIKNIKKSLASQEQVLQLATMERNVLQERLKTVTGCEQLVDSVIGGVASPTDGLKLVNEYDLLIKGILEDPDSVHENVEKMSDILLRYAAMMGYEEGTDDLDITEQIDPNVTEHQITMTAPSSQKVGQTRTFPLDSESSVAPDISHSQIISGECAIAASTLDEFRKMPGVPPIQVERVLQVANVAAPDGDVDPTNDKNFDCSVREKKTRKKRKSNRKEQQETLRRSPRLPSTPTKPSTNEPKDDVVEDHNALQEPSILDIAIDKFGILDNE